MAQAIVQQPMTARDRAWSLASKCGVCGGRSGSEVCLQEFPFTPVGIIPKMLQRIYLLPTLCDLSNWERR
jgi:hypothetical protein